MRISIVGAGYVGLVSGACLADLGHDVICIDVDRAKVEQILRGKAPIHEPGLDDLLRRNVGSRLGATMDLQSAVRATDLTLIAVGTPHDGARIDLSYVREAARSIGEALREKSAYHVVVVKSTVVPGTTENEVVPCLEEASGKKAGADFGVAVNPEFLTEGQAVQDFKSPDRLVLGAIDDRSMKALDELYQSFAGVPRIRTNTKTAEMIKYASNALLATAISFANEIGNLCAALGAVDVVDVMEGVHASAYLTVVTPQGERVKAPLSAFLEAGCGFGGSCLPKDVRALIAHGEEAGVPMPLLRSVIAVNEAQPRQIATVLERSFWSLRGLRVAVLGLAFKPGTSDVRESPALPVIRSLLERGAIVCAYDPVAREEARRVLGGAIAYADTLADCLNDADAVVLLTRWKEFDAVPELLRTAVHAPLVIDGRRQLDKNAVAHYAGIGL